VSAPEGLLRVNEEFDEADLLTVSIDDRLDEDGFIVPGLGDAATGRSERPERSSIDCSRAIAWSTAPTDFCRSVRIEPHGLQPR